MIDEFTDELLFSILTRKPNVAIVWFTMEWDVLGGGGLQLCCYRTDECINGPKMFIFAFSFESRGRCETPQQFFLSRWLKESASVEFGKGKQLRFVWFGVSNAGILWLGNESSDSF